MTASHTSLLRLSTSEASLGGLKSLSQTSLSSQIAHTSVIKTEDLPPPPLSTREPAQTAAICDPSSNSEQYVRSENGNVSPEPKKEQSKVDMAPKESGNASCGEAVDSTQADAPLKASTFKHLNQKYLSELDYMLREFQKLERQLLGAKNMQTNESAGSKERREKLHAFILHLQETIQQIHTGCELEAAGKSTVEGPLESTGLSQPTKEKEEEENVQKLEEHILANLLPVKVRLKKQLAAQQGAKHNPAGMPVRGVVADNSEAGKEGGTFMASASRRSTQFGKPLAGGGSSLTQKLHGQTLGSEGRSHGHGVGQTAVEKADVEPENKKILYGGMALGSDRHQMKSSLTAASSAHRLIVLGKDVTTSGRKRPHDEIGETRMTESATPRKIETLSAPEVDTKNKPKGPQNPSTNVAAATTTVPASTAQTQAVLTAEQRRRLRRKRRKKKRLLREQNLQQSTKQQLLSGNAKRKKSASGSKKRGPRNVEYMCALCNEVYNSVCEFNPWWALSQQECPKCRKTQIPRIDISSPANAIEYHPALLAHADENAGAAAAAAASAAQAAATPKAPLPSTTGDGIQSSDINDSDLSDEDGLLSDDSGDYESDDSDAEALENMTPAEQAELEKFGADYQGPKFQDPEASRLLNLMLHSSTCPCRHKSKEHRDVCRSVKWMMLHVRDCPGTTSTFDVCPFPWCRKTKHLLYHFLSCTNPATCAICSPTNLNSRMKALRGLNLHRLCKHRKTLVKKGIAGTVIRGSSSGSSKPQTIKKATQRKSSTVCVPVPPARTASHPGESLPPLDPEPVKRPAASPKTHPKPCVRIDDRQAPVASTKKLAGREVSSKSTPTVPTPTPCPRVPSSASPPIQTREETVHESIEAAMTLKTNAAAVHESIEAPVSLKTNTAVVHGPIKVPMSLKADTVALRESIVEQVKEPPKPASTERLAPVLKPIEVEPPTEDLMILSPEKSDAPNADVATLVSAPKTHDRPSVETASTVASVAPDKSEATAASTANLKVPSSAPAPTPANTDNLSGQEPVRVQ